MKLLEYPNADRIILLLIMSIAIGMIWGVKGYIYGFLLLVPFTLPSFNVSKIPVFGYYLLSLSLKERSITFAGLVTLLFLTKLDRFSYLKKSLIFLTIVNILAILVAVEFGVLTGPEYYSGWYPKVFLYPSMLFIIVFRYANDIKTIKRMLVFLLIGNVVFVLLTQIFTSAELGYLSSRSGLRYGGFWNLPMGIKAYADTVILSGYLAITVILSVGFIFMTKSYAVRIPLLISIILSLKLMFFTFSRTGLYGTIVGTIIILSLNIFKMGQNKALPKKLIKLIVFIALIAILFVVGFKHMIFSIEGTEREDYVFRLLSPTSSGSNIYGRWDLFSQSIENSLSHPLGEGIDLIKQQTGANHHSTVTKYLSALGWFGMACFSFFISICIKCVWKATKSENLEIRKMAIIVFTCLIAFILMSFGIGILGPMWGIAYFWSLLALGVSLGYLDANTIRNRSESIST
ncbi:MAG: hypothetical protein GQ565_07175 [Candidatus Aegiribacteria sp.]|nr:hypothetical protein [Candidatus Aegiribacteria sp.]